MRHRLPPCGGGQVVRLQQVLRSGISVSATAGIPRSAVAGEQLPGAGAVRFRAGAADAHRFGPWRRNCGLSKPERQQGGGCDQMCHVSASSLRCGSR